MLVGQILPVSAEQSRTKHDIELISGAQNAVDLNTETSSRAVAGSDGAIWLKLNLGYVCCVNQIAWYMSNSERRRSWTCTETECICQGDGCNGFSLTFNIVGQPPDSLPSRSNCKYGNTAKIQRVMGADTIVVFEMTIEGLNIYIHDDFEKTLK